MRPVKTLRCAAPMSPSARITVAEAVRSFSRRLIWRAMRCRSAVERRARLGYTTMSSISLPGFLTNHASPTRSISSMSGTVTLP